MRVNIVNLEFVSHANKSKNKIEVRKNYYLSNKFGNPEPILINMAPLGLTCSNI